MMFHPVRLKKPVLRLPPDGPAEEVAEILLAEPTGALWLKWGHPKRVYYLKDGSIELAVDRERVSAYLGEMTGLGDRVAALDATALMELEGQLVGYFEGIDGEAHPDAGGAPLPSPAPSPPPSSP